MFSHLILIIILQNRFPCAHFTVEETRSEKGEELHEITKLGNGREKLRFLFLQHLITCWILKICKNNLIQRGVISVFGEDLINFH